MSTLATRTEALKNAKKKASKRRAKNTRAAYKSDFEQFAKWCTQNEYPSLPARPDIVALYISALDDKGLKPSTIRRSLTSIRQAHKAASLPSPVNDFVRDVEQGIRRDKGIAPLKAAPITLERLQRIVQNIQSNFIGYRDKALFLVGWAGALRRSELVNIRVEDIEDRAEGIVIRLRKSKTDQEGKGRPVPIPFINDASLCPVRALRKWIDVSGISSDFVFRSIGPGGIKLIYEALPRNLTPRSISLIIKRHVKRAGYDPKSYSGHSLRSGFITSAAAAGCKERHIMAITGHASQKVMREYIQEGTLFKDTPLYLITSSPVVTDWDQNSQSEVSISSSS